jgi:hypothetical protein
MVSATGGTVEHRPAVPVNLFRKELEVSSFSLRAGLVQGLALLVFGLLSLPAWGADQRFSLGLGFEFASGDYGTDLTTDSYRIPLTVNYFPSDRIDLSLEIPYVHQSTGTTVSLGGMRFPGDFDTDDSGMGGGGGGMNGGGMMGDGFGGGGTAQSDRTDSQSGLGDITLTAGLTVVKESAAIPLVRPIAYVKFPTADEDKGLGTGELDYGGGLSLAKWFGSWSAYAEGMYVLPGSSSDFDPDNYWTWLGSLGYRFTDHLISGLALSGATAAFDGAPDALEAKARVTYWTSERASLGGYVSKGLSDGSPDYGLGIFGAVSW